MNMGNARRAGPRFLLLLCLAAVSSITAWADATLDFQMAGAAGGTVAYAGGFNPLTGTNIPIRLVAGAGTPLNDGVSLAITSGLLNFSTGSYYRTLATGELAFYGMGSFNITGSIASLGLNNATLLTGQFLGAVFDPTLGQASVFIGNGQDQKDPALVSHYFGGITPTWSFGGTIITGSVASVLTRTGSFSTAARSVDILNTAVPEPASIVLLGTILVAVGILARRRWSVAADSAAA